MESRPLPKMPIIAPDPAQFPNPATDRTHARHPTHPPRPRVYRASRGVGDCQWGHDRNSLRLHAAPTHRCRRLLPRRLGPPRRCRSLLRNRRQRLALRLPVAPGDCALSAGRCTRGRGATGVGHPLSGFRCALVLAQCGLVGVVGSPSVPSARRNRPGWLKITLSRYAAVLVDAHLAGMGVCAGHRQYAVARAGESPRSGARDGLHRGLAAWPAGNRGVVAGRRDGTGECSATLPSGQSWDWS